MGFGEKITRGRDGARTTRHRISFWHKPNTKDEFASWFITEIEATKASANDEIVNLSKKRRACVRAGVPASAWSRLPGVAR